MHREFGNDNKKLDLKEFQTIFIKNPRNVYKDYHQDSSVCFKVFLEIMIPDYSFREMASRFEYTLEEIYEYSTNLVKWNKAIVMNKLHTDYSYFVLNTDFNFSNLYNLQGKPIKEKVKSDFFI